MYGLISGERTLLRKQAKRTKRAAFADGTHKNLLAQWRTFLQFCQYIKCQPLPVSAKDLCLFAQFLARSFKSVDSIRNYISGVRTLHSLLGLTCGANDSLELKLLLKGIGRLQPHKRRQAAPLSPPILTGIFHMLDMNDTMHATMWALVLIGFFTLSRKSNLVVTGNNKFDKTKQLCRGDIALGKRGMLVQIRWSKTNQFGRRVIEVPLLRIKGSVMCPLSAYKHMLRKVPGTDSDPAFCLPSKRSNRAVTYWELQNFIKRHVAKLGLDPKNIAHIAFAEPEPHGRFRRKSRAT